MTDRIRGIEIHMDSGSVMLNPHHVSALFLKSEWAKLLRDIAGGARCTEGWEAFRSAHPEALLGRAMEPEDGFEGPFCIKLSDCTWWCP